MRVQISRLVGVDTEYQLKHCENALRRIVEVVHGASSQDLIFSPVEVERAVAREIEALRRRVAQLEGGVGGQRVEPEDR